MSLSEPRKIFTYDEAIHLLPRIQLITQSAVSQVSIIGAQIFAVEEDEGKRKSYEREQAELVNQWVQAVEGLGCEVKGLWLVDFDNGEGYYCWVYPESTLAHFHGYSEGFAGRRRIS